MQDGTRLYFLDDVLIFLEWNVFRYNGYFRSRNAFSIVPSQVVQLLEILKVEFKFREVCYNVLKTSGPEKYIVGDPSLPAASTIPQKVTYSFLFLADWTIRLVKRLSSME